MYEILKDFNFSYNGINTVSLKKGGTFNYTSRSIDGLIQEGFLKEIVIEDKVIDNIETKPLSVKRKKKA